MATVFAPASIGNVGPGFDVLGLAVEGLGDLITVELCDGPPVIESITGLDAELVPRDASANCAAIAAGALLRAAGVDRAPAISIDRKLPLSGGLGASAASSIGGAVAAARAANVDASDAMLLAAALEGEACVAGRHLDNIAPCFYGGLTIVRSLDPIDVVRVPLSRPWFVAVVTPAIKIATKDARRVLPPSLPQDEWVAVMAQTTSLVTALITGDVDLVRRSLVDPYAEPRRSALIPGFDRVKAAALDAGALGCSISGAGPTVFALAEDETTAQSCGVAMAGAFAPLSSTISWGTVAQQGVRTV